MCDAEVNVHLDIEEEPREDPERQQRMAREYSEIGKHEKLET